MSEFKELLLKEIVPSKTNPRTEFEENSLKELAESIKTHGVLQPIIVRKNPDNEDNYELVCGERRFRASSLAGLKSIPASIRELNNDEVLEIQVLENLQREDVSPMDEAKAFKSILGRENLDWLASKINKSTKYVLNRIKLLDLAEELHVDLEKGKLPLGHAYALTRLPKEDQLKMSNWAINGESLTVFKNRIKYCFLEFDNAPFDVDDETLLPKVGSCTNCNKRTINNQLLFEDITSDDRCTDEICFNAKIKNYWEKIKNEAFEKYGEMPVVETCYGGILYNENDYEFSKEETEQFSYPVYIERDRYSWRHDEDLSGKTVFININEHDRASDDDEVVKEDWEAKRIQNTLETVENIVSPRLSVVDKILTSDLKKLVRTSAVEILSESSSLMIALLGKKLGYRGGKWSEIDNFNNEQLVKYFDSLPYDKRNSFVYEMSQLIASRYSLEQCVTFSNMLLIIDELEEDDEEPVFSEEGKNWSGFINLLGVENKEERKCRVCGCTEENCTQCIEKTGGPCYWIEDDLCSACVEVPGRKGPIKQISVSQTILKKIVKSGNLKNLNEDIAEAYVYEDEKYVYTGAVGAGDGKGWKSVEVFKAIPQEDYDGEEPLVYVDYCHEVSEGKRERGYEGRIVYIDSEPYILTEKVEFIGE